MYNSDQRQYENQVIEALRSIGRAVAGTSVASSERTSATSSSSNSGIITAINGVSSKLDGIIASLSDIVDA